MSRTGIAVGSIVLILIITTTVIVAALAPDTLVMLIAMSVSSAATGFAGGLGAVEWSRYHHLPGREFLRRAEEKAMETHRHINATIIRQEVFTTGDGDSANVLQVEADGEQDPGNTQER